MPGQFVRVHLVGAIYKNAILIPSSAVLNSAQGKIAYVIDANNMVAARPIQAELQDDMYIVSDGLKAGEKVVSDGLIRLRPGMQVTAQMQKFMPVQPAPAASQPTTEGDVAKLDVLCICVLCICPFRGHRTCRSDHGAEHLMRFPQAH